MSATAGERSANERLEQVAQCLRAAALERAMRITPDGRLSEADAAELIDLHPTTLKGLRNGSQGPSFYYRSAGNGSRVSYRFDDLAAWLERGRIDA